MLPRCFTPRSPATSACRTWPPWSARSSSALADGDVAAAAVDGDLVGGVRGDQRRRDVDVTALVVWGGDVVRGAVRRENHRDVAALGGDRHVLRELAEGQGDVAATRLRGRRGCGQAAEVDVAALGTELEITAEAVDGHLAAAGVQLHHRTAA